MKNKYEYNNKLSINETTLEGAYARAIAKFVVGGVVDGGCGGDKFGATAIAGKDF